MTSTEIIERLLENNQITASEALQLLQDMSSNRILYPYIIPNQITYPYNQIVYA